MEACIQLYKNYIKLERSLSPKTVEAYLHDVEKLNDFLGDRKKLEEVELSDLQSFLASLYDENMSARSQARIISGLKSFYKFMLYESVNFLKFLPYSGVLQDNP